MSNKVTAEMLKNAISLTEDKLREVVGPKDATQDEILESLVPLAQSLVDDGHVDNATNVATVLDVILKSIGNELPYKRMSLFKQGRMQPDNGDKVEMRVFEILAETATDAINDKNAVQIIKQKWIKLKNTKLKSFLTNEVYNASTNKSVLKLIQEGIEFDRSIWLTDLDIKTLAETAGIKKERVEVLPRGNKTSCEPIKDALKSHQHETEPFYLVLTEGILNQQGIHWFPVKVTNSHDEHGTVEFSLREEDNNETNSALLKVVAPDCRISIDANCGKANSTGYNCGDRSLQTICNWESQRKDKDSSPLLKKIANEQNGVTLRSIIFDTLTDLAKKSANLVSSASSTVENKWNEVQKKYYSELSSLASTTSTSAMTPKKDVAPHDKLIELKQKIEKIETRQKEIEAKIKKSASISHHVNDSGIESKFSHTRTIDEKEQKQIHDDYLYALSIAATDEEVENDNSPSYYHP